MFPDVPVRQWVRTLPSRVRDVLAWDHALCRAVVAVFVRAGARDRLERLCRYALRPAVGQERLHIAPDGQVVLDLRCRWAAGTTQLVFDPVKFLERLAALVPRPRITLILYYGVLAPRAAWRAVALIRDAAVVGRILRHLGLSDVVPVPRAGRAPPLAWEADVQPEWPGVG